MDIGEQPTQQRTHPEGVGGPDGRSARLPGPTWRHHRWTTTELRWNLTVDDTEPASLTDLAANCFDQTVTYTPADCVRRGPCSRGRPPRRELPPAGDRRFPSGLSHRGEVMGLEVTLRRSTAPRLKLELLSERRFWLGPSTLFAWQRPYPFGDTAVSSLAPPESAKRRWAAYGPPLSSWTDWITLSTTSVTGSVASMIVSPRRS